MVLYYHNAAKTDYPWQDVILILQTYIKRPPAESGFFLISKLETFHDEEARYLPYCLFNLPVNI